jgi:tetratricopeptide (TPR) repeat protein
VGNGRSDAPVAADARPKRKRLPGVNLRPGSVKQARLEARLSLAQLGKGSVTAPAIYLIETGRTRPSMPTLEHIARQTGKPVEFFLAEPAGSTDDFQARLIELEALVADARNHDAISLGSSLLEHASAGVRRGRLRFLLAQAYIGAAQPDRATPLLAEARSHFEAVNDGAMLAECIGAQATVATMTQAKDSVYLAEMALSVCRALKPVAPPTEARLLAILGDAHAANRDRDLAVAAYEEAIEVSVPLSDLRRAARMYAGLGAAYRDAGQVEAAARYTSRSVALNELFHDRDALAKTENSLALVLISRGDLGAARVHLDRALELCAELDLGCGRAIVLLSLAELAMREDQIGHAQELASEALQLASHLEEGPTIAEAHVILGRIADRQGEPAEADRQFESAISAFETLGMRERLLQCHGTYAEVLERRGELARAYEHMKEALQASRPGLLKREQLKERLSSA